MKRNNLMLPHPVLGQSDNIIGDCGIVGDPIITITDTSYSLAFEIFHDNGTIADLVKYDKAIYICEVTCSGTLFREVFSSKEFNFQFDIERTTVKNKVDFRVYCIALVNLPNYTNPAAHEDYNDFTFELKKADPLAYFGSFDFNAGIEYQKLKAASSFMEIVPHLGEETHTDYVWDSKKIQIKLPRATYDKFRQDFIGKKKEFAAIIHASLVQNALTVALYNYKKALDMGEGQCIWAESIQHRLREEPELNHGSDSIEDTDSIPALVQKLLGNPNDRLIECLEMLSGANENESE
mgnify:CR=1 FL=1